MELRHLRYFEAVVREKSFSRASQKLHIAQPPLSRQIRQLEGEIGAELIDRSSRPLRLTPAGRFLYEQVVQITTRLDEVFTTTYQIAEGKRGWFGIGFTPSILYGMLPDLIRRFRTYSKGLEVGLLEMTTIEQADALRAGRIDIGFGRIQLDDNDISSEVMLNEPLIVALPTKHGLLRYRRLDIEKIAKVPLILYPAKPRPSYADYILKIFRTHNLVPNVTMEVNQLQTAIGLVAAGIGTTIVPRSVQGLHRDDVRYRALSEKTLISPVIMNTRVGDKSKPLGQFCDLVRKAYSNI